MPIAIAVGVYRIPGESLDEVQPVEHVRERPAVAQQVHEGVGADDERRPERDHHGHQREGLRAAREPADPERDREPDQQAEQRRAEAEHEAPRDRVDVQPFVERAGSCRASSPS